MSKAGQMRCSARVAAIAAFLCLAAICAAQLTSGAGQLQSSGTGQMSSGTHPAGGNASVGLNSPIDVGPSPFPDTTRQRRNDERQRRLVSDTQKLLTLTAQLKSEVASSGAETMSPEMLKQMEEIEKLAKSVKDKMRD